MLEPVIDRYKDTNKKLYFRDDAAFASPDVPDVYEYLEDERIPYAIRIPANQNLQRKIRPPFDKASRQAAKETTGPLP